MQLCSDSIMQWCNYATIQPHNCVIMQLWNYELCSYTTMQLNSYVIMQIMQLCNYATNQLSGHDAMLIHHMLIRVSLISQFKSDHFYILTPAV